jgi:hypothetical protein
MKSYLRRRGEAIGPKRVKFCMEIINMPINIERKLVYMLAIRNVSTMQNPRLIISDKFKVVGTCAA